jgi:hypothetical protein
VRHQLLGHLAREGRVQPPAHVDRGEFAVFARVVLTQLAPFLRQRRLLRVRLGRHRHVLAGSHRHRAAHQAGHGREQNAGMAGVAAGHAEHQARGRDDAVVGAEHRRAQTAHVIQLVRLLPASCHRCES